MLCNSLEFPVALIIVNIKNRSSFEFEISAINLFAVQLLNLNNNNKYDPQVFKKSASSFKETGLKKEKKKNSTLFDNIMKGNSKCYCANYINSQNQIIYAKITEAFDKIYIVIDDFDDDRVTVQERLISSIPRQYLITLSHELNNYFCGLITTLEEIQVHLKQEEIKTISSCVDLIKKMIKLFILYSKVSLDRIHLSSEKITQCMDLYKCLDIMFKKYITILNYKSIKLGSFSCCKGISIEADSYYFKNLLNVIFFYIYYKMPVGTEVNLSVTKLTNRKVSIGFVCNTSIDKSPSNYRSGTSNVVEDSEKITENEIKKSVVTIPILEYLIENISRFLNFEFNLGGVSSSFPPTEPGEFLTLKMTGTYSGNLAPLNNTSNTTSIFNGSTRPSSYNFKVVDQNNSVHNMTFNEEQNLNGSLLFSYEKKNTFEKIKSVNHSMDQGRLSINEAILPSRTFNRERKETGKTKTIKASIKNVSLLNDICGPDITNGCNSTFFRLKKKLSNTQNRNFLCLEDSLSHYSRSSEDDGSPLNKNSKINQLLVKKKKSANQLSSFKKNSETNVSQYSNKDTIETNSSIRNKITQIEKLNKININAIIHSSQCDCRDIAVVDDEISILNSMINIIRRRNLQCDFFKDGKDVYEKIVSKAKCFCTKKYYKLILLDIYMPEWSGIKTCDKIAELIQKGEIPRNLNVVLISAHKEKDLNVPQYEFIKGFYQKPVSKNTVINILQQFYS